MAESKIETKFFRFWSTRDFPNEAERGPLVLHLRKETEEVFLLVDVKEREEYPNGYGLEGVHIDADGVFWKVGVVVYEDSPQISGVVMSYDMARNTEKGPRCRGPV